MLDGDWTCGGGHSIQCTGDVLWNYAPETCVIVLTYVTPIHSIEKKLVLKSFRPLSLISPFGIALITFIFYIL